MNAKHTQGRLVVNPIQLDQIATADAIKEIARASTHSLPPEVAIANARRLAACWNACDGLSTSLLENITTLGDTLASRFKLRDQAERELNKQRDELLGALSRTLGLVEQAQHILANGLADGLHAEQDHNQAAANSIIAKNTGTAK